MNDKPMDAITREWIESIAREHPFYAIHFSHQFLDGTDRHECGLVPNDWNGKKLYFEKEAT